MVDASRPRRHQHDAAGEERRLVDRVGHEHDRAAEFLPQRQQVLLQLMAGELVERGEWFVHQQQARPRHQRAGDRDAHAHAAGELPRACRLEAVEADAVQCRVHFRHRLVARHAAQTQRQEHVVRGARPGQQRGILEHEADLARARLVACVPDQARRHPVDPVRRSAAAASICRSPTGRAVRRNHRHRSTAIRCAAPRPGRSGGLPRRAGASSTVRGTRVTRYRFISIPTRLSTKRSV